MGFGGNGVAAREYQTGLDVITGLRTLILTYREFVLEYACLLLGQDLLRNNCTAVGLIRSAPWFGW